MTSGSNFPIGYTDHDEFASSIAYGASIDCSKYLMTWTDVATPSQRQYYLYAALVDTSGSPPIPFEISIGPGDQGGNSPAGVDFDGTNFLVVFNDDSDSDGKVDLYSTYVSPTGETNSGFSISSNAFDRTVAYGASEYLVVWVNGNGYVQGARVDTEGNVLDTAGINLSVSAWDYQLPAVAFGNSNYLVTWELDSSYCEKYAQLVRYEVSTPQTLLNDLINDVINLNLEHDISNSLDGKLENALAALDDLNDNNDVSAINTLNAFINEVQAQRGHLISEQIADALIASALDIIAAIES